MVFGFLFVDGFVAPDGRDRLLVQPDLGHDRRHAAADLPRSSCSSAGPAAPYYVTALSVGAIVCIASSQRRRDFAGPEDRIPRRRHAAAAADTPSSSARLISALALGPMLLKLNEAATVYVPVAQVAPGLCAPIQPRWRSIEALQGPQAAQRRDELSRLAQDRRRRRPGRQVPGGRPTAALSIWSIRASTARTRRGPTAPRCASSTRPRRRSCPTSSRASSTATCRGAGAVRRHDRTGARNGGHSVAAPSRSASICRSPPPRRSSLAAWCAASSIIGTTSCLASQT
ncbi:MAG: hypothetical protein MZV49_05540 [Rhodopseudomonas palustris]|nr:hypothetical protein [Rhodopseudomonas palustris]